MGDEKSIDSTKRIVLVAKLDPMLTTSPAHKMDSFIENSYPWIPQSDIVVCAEGEHARRIARLHGQAGATQRRTDHAAEDQGRVRIDASQARA